MRKYILFVTTIVAIIGCQPVQREAASPAEPIQTEVPAPQPTSTAMPEVAVKVISYNILYGGGISRNWDAIIPWENMRKDRTPYLVEYFNKVQPDVILLQEAYQWGDYVRQFAAEIGMDYFYADSGLAILTRYEILEIDAKPFLLRIRLSTPDGRELNVFNAHLSPFNDEARMCQLEVIANEISPFLGGYTILAGDMNFQLNRVDGMIAPETLFLRQAGLDVAVRDVRLNRDHIWLPSSPKHWNLRSWFEPPVDKKTMSDHDPIGALIEFSSVSAATLPPPKDVKENPLPGFLFEEGYSPEPISVLGFDTPCQSKSWLPDDDKNRMQKGVYILPGGKGDWNGVNIPGEIRYGQGVAVKFKFRDPESLSMFAQYLYSGYWEMDGYSEIGFIYQQREILPYTVIDNEHVFSPAPKPVYLAPETEYWLVIILRPDGTAIGYLQDVEGVLPLYEHEYAMHPSFDNLVWETGMSAQYGVVTVNEVIRFDLGK